MGGGGAEAGHWIPHRPRLLRRHRTAAMPGATIAHSRPILGTRRGGARCQLSHRRLVRRFRPPDWLWSEAKSVGGARTGVRPQPQALATGCGRAAASPLPRKAQKTPQQPSLATKLVLRALTECPRKGRPPCAGTPVNQSQTAHQAQEPHFQAGPQHCSPAGKQSTVLSWTSAVLPGQHNSQRMQGLHGAPTVTSLVGRRKGEQAGGACRGRRSRPRQTCNAQQRRRLPNQVGSPAKVKWRATVLAGMVVPARHLAEGSHRWS